MGAVSENTNLAAEFFVLSVLHRIGRNATLTIGNKKSVDIMLDEDDGKLITIDVKGLKDISSFPVDNCTKRIASHFIIFVAFCGRIAEPEVMPEIYIVPSTELNIVQEALKGQTLVYTSPKDGYLRVQLGRLRSLHAQYRNRWDLLK